MAPSRNNTGGGRGRGRGGRGGGRGGGGGPPRTSSNPRVDPKDLRAVAEQAARKRLYSGMTTACHFLLTMIFFIVNTQTSAVLNLLHM